MGDAHQVVSCIRSDLEDDDEHTSHKQGKKQKPSDTKLYNLKAELSELLQQPLMARGVSAKYPTSGSRIVIDDLLKADSECLFVLL